MHSKLDNDKVLYIRSLYPEHQNPTCEHHASPASHNGGNPSTSSTRSTYLRTIKLTPLKHDVKIQTPIQRRETLIHILEIQIRRLILNKPLPQIPIEDMHRDILGEPRDVPSDDNVAVEVDGELAQGLAVGSVAVVFLGFGVVGGKFAGLADLAAVGFRGQWVVAGEVGDEHLAPVLGEDGGGEGQEGEEEGWGAHGGWDGS
jgi:hypothetical protein